MWLDSSKNFFSKSHQQLLPIFWASLSIFLFMDIWSRMRNRFSVLITFLFLFKRGTHPKHTYIYSPLFHPASYLPWEPLIQWLSVTIFSSLGLHFKARSISVHTSRFVKTVLLIHVTTYNPINSSTSFHLRSRGRGGLKKNKRQFLIPATCGSWTVRHKDVNVA